MSVKRSRGLSGESGNAAAHALPEMLAGLSAWGDIVNRIYSPVDRLGFRAILIGPAYSDCASSASPSTMATTLTVKETVKICGLINGIAAGDPTWFDFAEETSFAPVSGLTEQGQKPKQIKVATS